MYDELGLSNEKTKRIVFHEITRSAILNAVENPRDINIDLVNAQQARRVLDRLVGFELSPVLWKKVKPSLSAGRVQSVAVRLIVEREREIFAFEPDSAFRVTAVFLIKDKKDGMSGIKAQFSKRFKTLAETEAFLNLCRQSQFKVSHVNKKPLKRRPAPPFTTSTLQQEANKKLGFSVSKTMSVAQQLYDAGKITYMRTDSVNLAETALQKASEKICGEMGETYLKIRKYHAETKGAQEAHEAIRPTCLDSEGSLVKKLEELGIGRPSTYAPTISTVQKRGYVVKENRDGVERNYRYLALNSNKIVCEVRSEITGAQQNKLFPTDIGMVVTDFLIKHFPNIVSYDFTAGIEEQFDDIALGKTVWTNAIDTFYKSFHKQVEQTLENSQRDTGERRLGDDPKTGKPVLVRIGRYGPIAQLGEGSDDENAEKPKFAPLLKNQLIETISLEQALKLLELPRELGRYEDKKVVVGIGRFGPYIRHGGKFVPLKKGDDDPLSIQLDKAIVLIEEKRKADKEKIIKRFDEDPDLQLLNGRWGPYLSYQKKNYKIPGDKQPATLTYEDCMELVKNGK